MNRVLNKDFTMGSYLNSALISFSDVFHPASCMQSYHVRESKEDKTDLFCIVFYLLHDFSASRAGESMEE
jgi:hypothetical protein